MLHVERASSPLSLLGEIGAQIQRLHLVARPLGFAEEFEAGFNARLPVEEADINPPTQLVPAIMVEQLVQQLFERNSVQWIIGLFVHANYPA